jgi:hypothetical protein
MKIVCSLGLFLIVTITSTLYAQTVHYDITKGEYKRKDEERVYVVGKVINVAYELQHRPSGADSQETLFSKGRQGLMTSGGTLWTFVDNIKGQDLQWNKDYLGKFIKIYGWVFHDAQYIEVDEFSMDGVDYAWSDSTNSFSPAD